MSVFDEILASVDENDKQVLEKYPQLRAQVEQLEKSYREADALLSQWEAWRERNWDDEHQTTRAHVQALQEAEELRNRLAQMESAAYTGEDMTFDDIKQKLAQEGYVRASDLENHLSPKFVSKKEQEAAFNRLASIFEDSYFKTAPLLLKHRDEFGEVLDLRELFKYAVDHNISDPAEAYERMVAPRRQQLLEEQRKKEIEEAERRGMEKAKLEFGMAADRSPTDAGGPVSKTPGLDALLMPEDKVPGDLPETVKQARLGDMRTAQAVYEEWRKSRAGTVQ